MRTMQSAAIWGRLSWAALVLLPASGCTLVVTSFEHTDHCQIAGSSSCGTCIRQKCQASVDTCCGDASCRGEEGHSAILDSLDSCASGDRIRCAAGIASAGTGTSAAVGSCVRSMCKAECIGTAVVEVPWTCGSTPPSDEPCAKCVLDSCAAAIAECCMSTSCAEDPAVAADIGSCIGGDTGRCTYRIAAGGTSGLAGKIRGCIAKSCASACVGRTHEQCDYRASGSYCSCSDAEQASGPACPGTTVTGDCVLGAQGCTCGNYECKDTSSSYFKCSCQFTGLSASTQDCDKGQKGACCLSFSGQGPTCECSELKSSCYKDEYSVESCSIDSLRSVLTNASAFVTSCSY